MRRREFIRHTSALAAGVCGVPAAFPAQIPAQAATRRDLERVTLHNVGELVPAEDGDGWRMCRIPLAVESRLNANAKKRSFAPAGSEIRFNLDEGVARILLRFIETRGGGSQMLAVITEVFLGDLPLGWMNVGPRWTEIVVDPKPVQRSQDVLKERLGRFDKKLVRVLLPLHTEVRLHSIEGAVSPPVTGQEPARRYLAYGSSITNGFMSAIPSEAYPERIGRLLGVDVLNLGFGGGAHLEPAIADHIAARDDWDFASVEMGINLIGSRPVDEFRSLVRDFLPRLKARRPERWIFAIDLFTCLWDFRADPKIEEYRRVVREEIAALGAPRLVHVDGRELLKDPLGLWTDLVHPTGIGFAEIAGALAARMKSAMAAGAA